jgi:hypothetical protein
VHGISSRQHVYAVDGALEIDEYDGYEVTRRRVFNDDILLVTHHSVWGKAFMIITGLATAFFTWIAFAIATLPASESQVVGFVFFLFTGMPFALAFLIRLVLRLDVVTVFGRRTKAIMRFALRKGRAREVFRLICERARAAQPPPAVEPGEGTAEPNVASDGPLAPPAPPATLPPPDGDAPPDAGMVPPTPPNKTT